MQHRKIILEATSGCIGHAQLRNGTVAKLVVTAARVVAELVHGVFITGLAQVELIELHGREKGIEIGESQTGETTHLGYSCKTVSENTFPILELIVLWHGLFT